jgi:parallel beta-helix repeat protein
MGRRRERRRARWLIPVVGIAVWLGYSPAAFAADLTITNNTTLSGDVSGTVFVGADNVSLDCAGHSVSSGNFAAIDVTAHSGVTIENCRVGGAAVAGIWLNGASGNTIVDNTTSGNANGILLFGGSSNNVVRGNDTSGNLDYGIFLDQGSNANTVAGNVANGMQYSGIFLLNVSSNTLSGNTAGSNGGASVGPLDAGQGVYLFNADHTTLDGNSASGNVSDGFQLRFSNANRLTNDTSAHNQRDGIALWDGSSGNTVNRATLNGNGSDGTQVVISPSNKVSNSTGNGNGAYGFDVNRSNNVTFASDGAATNTYGGFFSLLCTGGVYTNNSAIGNGGAPVGPLDQGEGFYLYEADQTTLTGNLAVDNVTDGFQLRGATHTLIQNNKSLANRRIGIGLFADDFGNLSTGNTITDNLARGNAVLDAQDIATAGANTWTDNNLGSVSLP